MGNAADSRQSAEFRRTEAELALVRRLAEVTTRLMGEIDVAEAIGVVAQAGADLLRADAAAIALTEDGSTYVNAATFGIAEGLHRGAVTMGQGLHGLVLERQAPVVLDDYDTWEHALPELVGVGFHATVGVPIRSLTGTVGVLSVHHRSLEARIGDHEVSVLTLLANHAGIAILRARAHATAGAEQQRFQALLDTMPDGLAVVKDGRLTAWNAAAERLTGLDAPALIGRPPPFDLDAAADRLELDTPLGPRWVEAVSNPMPGEGGVVWLLRDVTEQERLEQARNLFLATTSHELKTPLTVVKGLAITLRRKWDRMTVEQRAEALETIERRTIHLDRLVERVLVGSRVEAGVMDLQVTPVEVAPIIEDVIEGFAAVAPLHQIRADLQPEFPLVAADRQALDTIFGHLVDNAIKYSPEGGSVTIQGRFDDTRATLSVLDCGIGISGELADLLQPFAQGDRHTTRRMAGVGIGLYVVAKLVDGLGGRLAAVNRPGGGADFSFTISTWHDVTR